MADPSRSPSHAKRYYPAYSYAASTNASSIDMETSPATPLYRRWTLLKPGPKAVLPPTRSSAESAQTDYFNIDGHHVSNGPSPAAFDLPRRQPDIHKPLPLTPSSKYDEVGSSSKAPVSLAKPASASPRFRFLRSVRRIAMFGNKTKSSDQKSVSANRKPQKEKQRRRRSRSPPQKIIYAEKGTQTSFENLPATSMSAHGPPISISHRMPKSSSSDEDRSAAPLTPIHETAQQDIRTHARPTYRSLRSFLDTTSQSNPGTPSVHSVDNSKAFLTPNERPAAGLTPGQKLDLDLSRPSFAKKNPHNAVGRGSQSHDTTGTYDSYYSEPGSHTANSISSSGIAVTAHGITERPIINLSRGAASDSTLPDIRTAQSGHRREQSSDESISSIVSTPTAKTPKPPRSAPTRPMRGSHLSRTGSSMRLSPLRQMELPAPGGDSKLGQTSGHASSNIIETPQIRMEDLDKPSPVIFRRPIAGYFEIPPVNVHEVPDHLQGSIMCPLNSKHRGGQEDFCSIHGHLDMSNDQRRPSKVSDGSAGSQATISSSVNSSNDTLLRLDPYRAVLAPPHSPLGSPRTPGIARYDLGHSTAKAARVLMGSEGVPGGGDASKFELTGPDHAAGDARCPARNGRGICVWHGRVTSPDGSRNGSEGASGGTGTARVSWMKEDLERMVEPARD